MSACQSSAVSPVPETDASPPDTSQVDVLVAVVTYNSARWLPDLLNSMPAALAGCTWRFVVADNDSHDETLRVLRDLAPDATVVRMGRNAGYAAGINAAIAAGGSFKTVLILNPDTLLEPRSATTMRRYLDWAGVGIVVPRLVDENGKQDTSLRREPTLWRAVAGALFGERRMGRVSTWGESVTNPDVYRSEATADWACGAALLVSGDCVADCGPWDESFFLYSEETEYFLRARDHGYRLLYTPDVTAVHVGGDSHVSVKLRALLVVNRIKLYRRSHSAAATLAFWLIAVLREGSRALMGREQNKGVFKILISPRRMGEATVRAAAA